MSANHTVATTTRAAALKRVLLVAGGAVGAGVAGSRVLGRGGETVAAPEQRAESLVLYGRDWRLTVPRTEPGRVPDRSETRTPKGRIVDATGRTLGSFTAANLAGAGGVLQLQTFDLEEGTIVGVGAAGRHESPFAIVGGTGRFLGASGTYVARQSPRERGGDGTAEFTLSLIS
jgi:hypothetical protein